jgi:hypothetical protein
MFRSQLESLAHPAILGFYLFLSLAFLHSKDSHAALYALPVLAVVAFAAWLLSLRRFLTIGGTPTSKIASAAQGYVELVGRALPHPAGALRSRFTQLPCVWFQYKVEQRQSDGKWHRIESGRSTDSFLLDDGTGVCLIDPENAEMLPRRTDVSMQGTDYRCTESLILPNETVFAIGEFTTISGDTVDLNLNRDVSELLAEWKRNKPALLARFDLDKDGQISEKEWMLARAQARREVSKSHDKIRIQPGTHVLHQPHDLRPFLISNLNPSQLELRYKLWAWVHLFVTLGAVAGTAAIAR